MELNCLIFPAPKTYDMNEIRDNVILIPKRHAGRSLSLNEFLQPRPCNMSKISQDRLYLHVQPQDDILSNVAVTSHLDLTVSQLNTPLSTRGGTPLERQSDIRDANQPIDYFIPCLYLQGQSNKIIVFFHGNAEDIHSSYSFVDYINRKTGHSILAVEYQGYSIYNGRTSAESIEKDSLYIISYLLNKGYDVKNIVILGRSIGSGPAIFTAAHHKVSALVLISPFLSLCQLVEEKYGWLCGILLKQRFRNGQNIQKVLCPTFILHGIDDNIIPYSHSQLLQSKSTGYCKLKLAADMNHTEFHFMEDFIKPLRRFLDQIH